VQDIRIGNSSQTKAALRRLFVIQKRENVGTWP
jgi:hypothetical protein